MEFDVFISYPHQDKVMADAACARLEAEGIRCWLAPRDIAPSADWAASIVDAIDNCRVMVLIFSGHTNRSRQVGREVQQAFDGEKPVIPFRIEDVTPEKSLRYYMGSVHWLDALSPPVEDHLHRLVAAVQALLNATTPDADVLSDHLAADPMLREAAQREAKQQPQGAEARRRAADALAALARADAETASRSARRWIWKAAAIAGLCVVIAAGAAGYYVWRPLLPSVTAYVNAGNLACFGGAEFPESWNAEAPLCTPHGCNFGKMSQAACLNLGAAKQSKTVIHGNAGTTRANECWLQQSCSDMRPHSEFTYFKM